MRKPGDTRSAEMNLFSREPHEPRLSEDCLHSCLIYHKVATILPDYGELLVLSSTDGITLAILMRKHSKKIIFDLP